MSSESRKPSGPALVQHKCTDCGYTTSVRSRLTTHRRVHSGERPFACPSCDATFKQKVHCENHVRQVHLEPDHVTCTWSGCVKTFASVASVQRHVAAVHLKTRYPCPFAGCAYFASWKSGVALHIQAVHSKQKRFICSVEGCNYKSCFRSNFQKHMRAKHKMEQLACSHDGCGFRTSWPVSLKQHVEAVHEKQVRFACHVCGKGFYWKTSFRVHQEVHAKQGHPVAACVSCQESLLKGSKRSSLINQEEQASSSSDGVSDLLTSLHLDMHLLSLNED